MLVEDDLTIPPLTLATRPWAIRRDALVRIAEAHRAAAGAEWARLAAANVTKRKALRANSSQRAGGAVAVLPLTGVLTPRTSFLSWLFGGMGLMDFRDEFRAAVQSPDIGAIVLDVDSPGGLVDLVPETAAEIRDARGSKPIVAVANTLAASGAYWIAAQADEIVVTPSGDVGSVGVYTVHEDWSAANQKMGVDVTYVHAGKYKVEGNPDEPLGDDGMAAWQQEVDDLYTMFVEDLAAGRDVSTQTVISDYGEGRTKSAARAVESGMADRVDTLESVIGALLTPGATGTAAALAGRLALTAGRQAAAVKEPAGEPAPEEPREQDPAPEPEPLAAESRAAIASLLLN